MDTEARVPLYLYRLTGAALLDRGMYEGIEADGRALPQAVATVMLSSLAAGIGAAGWRGPDPALMILTAALALVTWLAWAMLMLQIGGHLLPVAATRTSLPELLRTIGFAAAPGLLQVFAALPVITVPVFVIAWIWMFAATVVAVRQALDYRSTLRTIVVCLLAAGISLGMAAAIGLVLAPTVR